MTRIRGLTRGAFCALVMCNVLACSGATEGTKEHADSNQSISNELAIGLLRGDIATVKRALDAGALVDLPDVGGQTPLMVACGAGFPDSERQPSVLPRPTPENLKMLQLLLERGAKVSASNAESVTALDSCIFHGRAKSVEVLLKAGAKVVISSGATGGPLARAAYQCLPDIVDLLLQYGADPSAKIDYKTTAREYAAKQNCSAVVRLLDEKTLPRKLQ